MNEPTYHPELEALIRQVRTIDHEASGMLNAPAEVRGPGFFPGAWGGPDPSRAISQRPIMVLGQDQDNWVGFKKSMRKRTEEYSPTWRNLRVLLDQAAIDLDAVFLTNFIVGFRRQGFSTGPSPALASPAYLQASAQFFLYQLSIQRPRLIITLGVQPLVLLGLVSEFVLYRTVPSPPSMMWLSAVWPTLRTWCSRVCRTSPLPWYRSAIPVIRRTARSDASRRTNPSTMNRHCSASHSHKRVGRGSWCVINLLKRDPMHSSPSPTHTSTHFARFTHNLGYHRSRHVDAPLVKVVNFASDQCRP